MAIGMVVTLVVTGIIGGLWLVHRHSYVAQTREQMAYLADLSGYALKEAIPERTQAQASELTRFTTMTQGEVSYWVIFLGGGYFRAGSYAYQLTRKYPSAISEAMKGDTAPAQQLEAKWLKDRNIRFFPFGMTLMLMFLLGLVITLLAAVQEAGYWEKGSSR